ncbi:MAG: hypothetical protein EB141_21070 [Verrucomicrobia bacterium]|nr:hypothetical protein [Verrucomicrobiota bacterium]NBU09527.1 hypothetical protein [Pseudomonadota bacterium]NDB78102.1 hypothetical protein [Verrucomicrobiota bacterium]NDD40010.1 hypothetical protein [Verrucomicrobiota bacterium]
MTRFLLCLLLATLPCTACKKKPADTPVAEVPAAPPNPEADLKALNEAARAYVMGQLKDPDTLDDLVKAGFLKRLPAAPAGKKYLLSQDKKSVQLVDR